MRTLQEGSKAPVVVHCSAGIGRTGVVIALDMCMDLINNNEKVTVALRIECEVRFF